MCLNEQWVDNMEHACIKSEQQFSNYAVCLQWTVILLS